VSYSKPIVVFFLSLALFTNIKGQRQYSASSVLSSGVWLKISVDSPGIYRVGSDLLKKGGVASQIKSSSIRLFGNGGRVLPTSNSASVVDDLVENAISVFDGGDGSFDEKDYFLFYAPGPNDWRFDSTFSTFKYQKNPYARQAHYFINIGNVFGKRISLSNEIKSPNDTIVDFVDHYRHEIDLVNFLKSGSEWYGEEFDAQKGNVDKKFSISFPSFIPGSNFVFSSEVIGRSSIKNNLISVSINGRNFFDHVTSPVNSSLIDPVASVSQFSKSGIMNASQMEVAYTFSPGSVNAKAWLNYFEVQAKRKLDMKGLPFLQFNRIAQKNESRPISFSISNPPLSIEVWDITSLYSPVSIKVVKSNGDAIFNAIDSGVRNYIAFDPTFFKAPKFVVAIKNQNLHAQESTDMIIVSDKALLLQAERLASFHRKHDKLKVVVTDVGLVFNEFSSGSLDPTAIRNYVKMFYDKAGANIASRPKYLLLLGAASYIYKEEPGAEKNNVPSFQSESSLDPLSTYVTDDYFGFLDDSDDIKDSNINPELDIAVGRIPARTVAQAKNAVDKIISYHESPNFGPWRNEVSLLADDEDYNLHLNDAEYHAAEIIKKASEINLSKLYFDAFEQASGIGGNRYPKVVEQINQHIDKGLLIFNYSGHGSSTRLAQESILDKPMVSKWNNKNKLPLFITATCDFAPFDDPGQFSLGEELLLGNLTGAVGLLTTTRLVFASSNRIINNNYFKYSLIRDSTGRYPSLGLAMQQAKNFTVTNSGDYINARKFVLIGDPAMKLALPDHRVRSTSINGKSFLSTSDTLKSLNKYVITGEVLKPEGVLASDFNGYVYPVVYDKPLSLKTKGNDEQSLKVEFQSRQNMLYKGKVKAQNGKFTFDFIVPKDIDPEYGTSKISYYAENGIYDAVGADVVIQTGGVGLKEQNDGNGPRLECYLNDSTFKNGGTVGPNPVIKIKMYDSSGINFSQLAIGHEITATLDQDFRKTYFLNDFFEPASVGSLNGMISFPLSNISKGDHQLEVRAWDVFNNSGTCKLNFKVVPITNTTILSFGCYPNPIVNQASFTFSVDGLTGPADVSVQVFTGIGQQLIDLKKVINLQPEILNEIQWDGLDANGLKVQRGLYFCRLTIKNSVGEIQQKLLKIIKL
jgi:hypothetical protein